ncbi:MAG TPA: IS5/IS1182 family transposase, partial [Methylococcales bacterium]
MSRRACELTTPEVGDPTAFQDLLDQITTPFDTFMGDGAYDGEPVSQAVLDKQPDAQVVIPPHKSAVTSTAADSQRNRHIQTIAQE